MREIKFRAYSEDKEKVFDVHYIDLLRKGFGIQIGQNSESVIWEFPDEFILLEFTGLKDRTGKEIYEGDVVKLHDVWKDSSTAYSTYLVKINSLLSISFICLSQTEKHKSIYGDKIDCDVDLGYWVFNYLEVIGNIYENKI